MTAMPVASRLRRRQRQAIPIPKEHQRALGPPHSPMIKIPERLCVYEM